MSTTSKPLQILISSETSQSVCDDTAGYMLQELANMTETPPRVVVQSALYLLKVYTLGMRRDR